MKTILLAGGLGTRLSEETILKPKPMVEIGGMPILWHIMKSYAAYDYNDFAVALGYKGDLVKDFLELSYPDRTFYFVNVKPYRGKESGLGYSLLCCEKYLQEPFVFISCDTLVKEQIPYPKFNWMGYSSKKKLFSYRTLQVKENKIIQIS